MGEALSERQWTGSDEVLRLRANPHWDGTEAELLTRIGVALEAGTIFCRDIPSAMACYREAAAWGDARGMTRLADLLRQGSDADAAQARILYERAAGLGYAPAMVRLGDCEEDEGSALQWYRRSAEQKDPEGLFRVAICCHEGRGTAQDRREAHRLFSLLADQDHPGALYYMGLYAQQGYLEEPNYLMARMYFRCGLEQRDGRCCRMLGMLCELGQGCRKDPQEAASYYRRAGELGEARGFTDLARLLASGVLGPQRRSSAKHWYAMAALQGEPEALQALHQLGCTLWDEDMELGILWEPVSRRWRSHPLPARLLPLLGRWDARAEAALDHYQFLFAVRRTCIYFTCEGQNLRLTPETFGIPEDLFVCFLRGELPGQRWDTSLEQDLLDLGCTNVHAVADK